MIPVWLFVLCLVIVGLVSFWCGRLAGRGNAWDELIEQEKFKQALERIVNGQTYRG